MVAIALIICIVLIFHKGRFANAFKIARVIATAAVIICYAVLGILSFSIGISAVIFVVNFAVALLLEVFFVKSIQKG